MIKTRHRILELLLILCLVLLFSGCVSSINSIASETSAAPAPILVESPNPAYANAQATLDYGKGQLLELSRKSTGAALDTSRAANAAAASTQDFNRRQKMDLDYQATVISLNIAQAAATQKYILQLTRDAVAATAAAQNTAVAATQSAELANSQRTAQAQALLDAQYQQTFQAAAGLTAFPVTATYVAHTIQLTEAAAARAVLVAQAAQTAQANATLTAYPLTATPYAALQAALLQQQYNQEQKSFIEKVIAPIIPVLAVLDLLLFILVVMFPYRRFVPLPWPRRLRVAELNSISSPLRMIDGVLVDRAVKPQPPVPFALMPANPAQEHLAHVEIANALEAPVAHWVAEVEQQLAILRDLS